MVLTVVHDVPYDHAWLAEATSQHLAGWYDDHEGLRVDGIDHELDLRDLGQRHDDEHDIALAPRECALPMQESHAAADFHDSLGDGLSLVRDDEHGLAAVEAGRHFIRDHGIHEHADQREHGRRHTKQESADRHDDAVESEYRAAHIERVELLDHGAQDIEPARIAVHAEHDAVADAVADAAEYGRKHQVIHGGVSVQKAGQVEAQREYARADDRIHRIAASHQPPRGDEQRDVVGKCLQTDGQLRQIVDDDGDAGRTARQQMRRHEEEIDRAAGYETA